MPEKVATIESFLARISRGENAAAGFLPGSSPSWLIGLIQRRLKRPMLILAPEEDKAEQAAKELALFGACEPVIFSSLDYYQPEGTERSGERAGALARILKGETQMVVASAVSVFQPTIPRELLKGYLFELKPGAKIHREELLSRLIAAGYQRAATVSEPGEVSSRGGIIDVFPPGAGAPARIDFFGNEVESIRFFEPADQKSKAKAESCLVWPAREMILTEDRWRALKQALFRLAEEMKKEPGQAPAKSFARALQELTSRLDREQHFYGEERFLPLIDGKNSLLDYLSGDWMVVMVDELAISQSLGATATRAQEDWARLVAGGSFLPPPGKIFLASEELSSRLAPLQKIFMGVSLKGKEPEPASGFSLKIDLEGPSEIQLAFESNPELGFSPKFTEPISRFLEELKRELSEKFSLIVVSSSRSQSERLSALLREHEIYPAEMDSAEEFYAPVWPLALTAGELSSGVKVPEFGLVLVSEREIFGEKIKRPLAKPEQTEWMQDDLSDLEPGELVVHIEHGIGIYRGMSQLKVSSFEKWDYLKDRSRPRVSQPVLEIEYAEGARLYLPVDQIHLVQKYRNPGESRPRLDRLGSQSFIQAKQRAEQAILNLAHELLDLYASREVFPGFNYAPPDHTFREFEASFDYEETPDQEKVIGDVLADLLSGRPMDRLVLGDVGYGKTEVALRASFLAAMQGKQVALLCPTTILAQQHFDNFRKRLADWPLEVRMLSRFSTRTEQKKIVGELKAGLCDVAIGTHRLLSKDVEFRELGLLIVDEEQRFGVVQKEKVKQLKKTVDCLTLSATPIPRTMQMTMLGLRDLSIINTPPPDRQAIHTELIHFDQQLIREAILRELKRQGQVFFVHNRVQGIDQIARWLIRLVPEARIAIAHGQMDERRLEKVMHDFYRHEYDVLVSTAIIESGLDLPSANTIIINRADQFGLAQLYQLRGRIGRSRERGYAYLVVPSRAEIKGEAVKRLKALKEFTELGSGFRLAAYDLKIRGAGNLLGREQSGQISRIGYELYLRLLENKVKELKGQKLEEGFEPRIKLALPAFLPEDYVPGDSERLSWYKRLAMALDETSLNSLRDELLDRYGKIPEPAENLLQVVRLKFSMRKMKIPELDADEKQAVISFEETSRVNFDRLLELVQTQPDRFRLTKDQSVVYSVSEKSRLFAELESLFAQIQVQAA